MKYELIESGKQPNIAIVDDDVEIHGFLQEFFRLEGYAVDAFFTGMSALEAMKEKKWDLIICDLQLPDVSGLEIIERLVSTGDDTPVVLITAHATVETAAQAMMTGAFDYITKPLNTVELSVICKRAIMLRRLEKNYEQLQKQLEKEIPKGGLIGKSHKMLQIFKLVNRVASSTANVLITGESGTGKEMVARAIHGASPRASKPFIAINCSAIPDNLLESELFGHKRGAFTGANENRRGLFEEANGGTLFLDEIGDMPLQLQTKILRVIQDRKIKPVGGNEIRDVDVRILAATHKDLRRAIADGSFREDLYFRLCVVPINIPPLRERTEDIPALADYFLSKYCEKNSTPQKRLTKPAISKLMRLSWVGNVRELENTIERAVVLSERATIDDSEIRTEIDSEHETRGLNLFSGLPTLSQLEKEYIAYVLTETNGRKERTAEILGINRKTLYRKVHESGAASQ